MSIESQLRETLYRAANTLDPTAPPPEVRAPGMRVLAQCRDRRRAAVLSAGLAVLIVAIGVPVGLSLVQSNGSRVAAPIPSADVFGVPTRGSLAADAEFVEGVRQLSWTSAADEPDPGTGTSLIPEPPIETRRVVFAGDVAAGRWALVVGRNTAQPPGEAADPDQTGRETLNTDVAALWFAGPPEATAEQMDVVGIPRGVLSDLPISLYHGPTGALVVVAAPEDVIEISLRPEVVADATVTRNYQDAEAPEGLVVTAVEPNPYVGKPAVQYRVTRAGVVVAEQSPDGYGTTVDAGIPSFTVYGTIYPDLELDYLRSPIDPSIEDPTLAQRMAWEILGEYGLRPEEVDLQVHYVGAVPGSAAAPVTLTVLSATFPSGALVTRAAWRQQLLVPENPGGDPVFGEDVCVDELAPAGTPAAERVMALRCDVLSGVAESAGESTLVVLAPPTLSGAFAVVDGNSGAIRLALTDDGVAIAAFPVGARSVVVEAADGTVLDEVPISAP